MPPAGRAGREGIFFAFKRIKEYMGKKYYDDDELWDEIDTFYEENKDVQLRESIDGETTTSDYFNDEPEEKFDKDALTYGENDHPEYVKNLTVDLIDENGNTVPNEIVGRLDMEGRTYLLLHPMNAEDKALINIFHAFDDKNGELAIEGISDPDELKRVIEFAEKVLYDDPEATDVPGGGVQWSD